jgi:hypothetical protein
MFPEEAQKLSWWDWLKEVMKLLKKFGAASAEQGVR